MLREREGPAQLIAAQARSTIGFTENSRRTLRKISYKLGFCNPKILPSFTTFALVGESERHGRDDDASSVG
jgi:hypothetical protein